MLLKGGWGQAKWGMGDGLFGACGMGDEVNVDGWGIGGEGVRALRGGGHQRLCEELAVFLITKISHILAQMRSET